MNAAEIGLAIQTQDNACTAHPIFMVQSQRRIYGMDPDYSEEFVWLHADECDEVDSILAAELEGEYQKTYDEREGYRRVAYMDLWENVQPFFTRAGAEDYLARNGHNLKTPRIYVESAYRNQEWQLAREIFANAAAEVRP